MTAHGTFIINGVERIVVPQLARSYGVFFEGDSVQGQELFRREDHPGSRRLDRDRIRSGRRYLCEDRPQAPLPGHLALARPRSRAPTHRSSSEVRQDRRTRGDHDDARRTTTRSPSKKHSSRSTAACATATSRPPNRPATTSMPSFRAERYDFSKVGRFHFNRRFGLPTDEKHLAQRHPRPRRRRPHHHPHRRIERRTRTRTGRHRPPRLPPRSFRRRIARTAHARRPLAHEAQHPGPHGDG